MRGELREWSILFSTLHKHCRTSGSFTFPQSYIGLLWMTLTLFIFPSVSASENRNFERNAEMIYRCHHTSSVKNIIFCDIPFRSILLFYNLSGNCWSLTLIMLAYSCENSLIIIERNSQHKLRQKAILNLSFRIQNTEEGKKFFTEIHCRFPFTTVICYFPFYSIVFLLPGRVKKKKKSL